MSKTETPLGIYDGDLQMFVREIQEARPQWLDFLVWLKDRGDFAEDILD